MEDRYRRLHYDPTVISNAYWQQPPPKIPAPTGSHHKKHLPPPSKKKSKDSSGKAELLEVPHYLKQYRDKYGSVSAHSTSAIYGALRAPHCHAMYNTSDMWYASVRSLNSRPREVLYPGEPYDWREGIYEDVTREGFPMKPREMLRHAPCICMVRRKAPASARPPARCKYCATAPPSSGPLNTVPLTSKRAPLLPEKVMLNAVSEEKDETKPEPIDRMSGYKKHINSLSKSKMAKYLKDSTKELIPRKSILEYDVTAYDLMKKLPNASTIAEVEDSDDVDDDLNDNAVIRGKPRLRKQQPKSKSNHSKIESLLHRNQKTPAALKVQKSRSDNKIYNDTSSVCLGGQRIFTTYQSSKSAENFDTPSREDEKSSLNGNSSNVRWRKISASEESINIPEPDYDCSEDSDETSCSSKFKDLKHTYSPPLFRKTIDNGTNLGACREISKSMSSLVSQDTIVPNISINHSYTSSPTIKDETYSGSVASYSDDLMNSLEVSASELPVEPPINTSEENINDDYSSNTSKVHSGRKQTYESFSSSDCSSNGGTISSDYPTWTSSSSGELKSILKKKKRESVAKQGDELSIFLSDSECLRKKQVQFHSSMDRSVLNLEGSKINEPSTVNDLFLATNQLDNDVSLNSMICDSDKQDSEDSPPVINKSENIYNCVFNAEKLNELNGKELSSLSREDDLFPNTGSLFENSKSSDSINVTTVSEQDLSLKCPGDVKTNSINAPTTSDLSSKNCPSAGTAGAISSLLPKMSGLSSSLEDIREITRKRNKNVDGESEKKADGRRKRRTTLPKRRFSDLHLHILLCPIRTPLCGDGSSSEDVPLTSPPHRAHRSLPESPSELQDDDQTFCFDFIEKASKDKAGIPSSRSTFYVPVEDPSLSETENNPIGESHHLSQSSESATTPVLPSLNSNSLHSVSDDEQREVDETTSPAADTDEDNLENEYENIDPIYEELSDISNASKKLPPLECPQKSFFEGASKTDILSYLEDAKERGLSEGPMSEDESKTIPEEDEEEEEECKIPLETEKDCTIVNKDPFEKEVLLIQNDEAQITIETAVTDETINENDKVNRTSSTEIERNDSGVGAETSKPSRINKPVSDDNEEQLCADCDHHVEQVEDELSGLLFSPLVCRKCDLRRCERKEIIIEFVDTEVKYGRDLRIVKEEFYRPMEIAGLLAKEQLLCVFLNLEELISFNMKFSEKLKDALDIAMEQGDEDYTTVNIGKIFLETSSMLHAFETYCVKQASASILLSNMEKEKELLRIFLRVSQMENTLLRRMNLPAFLMVPVQRVTRYPLLLSRLHKVTPIHHKDRNALKEAQQKVELHLEHINQQTKGVGGTKIWRRISNISASHRRMGNLQDIGNIKLRKMALEILKWKQDEVRFVMAGKLLFTQVTDYPWNKKGRTVKFTPLHALLVALGKPNSNYRPEMAATDSSVLFPRNTGIRDASLVLMKEKNGRFVLVREPLYLGTCVISCDSETDDVFEIQEYTTKEAYLLKGENKNETKEWLRQLKYHAKDLGSWRRRRNALANIMINGMIRP